MKAHGEQRDLANYLIKKITRGDRFMETTVFAH